MRILLDECVDRSLAKELVGHEPTTVGRLGWTGVKNGQLLRRAAGAGFNAFVSTDQGIPYQNDISLIEIAVFVLKSRDTRLPALLPLVPDLLLALTVLAQDRYDYRFVSQAPAC